MFGKKRKIKIKKTICVSLAVLLFVFNFCSRKVNALFGNAHFSIGKKVIEKLDKNISEGEKKAFLSGIVYADIGRFKFDNETGIASDSNKFVTEMKKFAKTKEEKWFVRGFEIHIFQDGETRKFLKDIFGHKYSSYITYVIDCGTLDSYFVKESGILYNDYLSKFNFEQVTAGLDMNKFSKEFDVTEEKLKKLAANTLNKCSKNLTKVNLVMYDKLIRKTYESFGYDKISLDDINDQVGNLLGVMIIVSAFVESKIQISEELALKIEQKSKELADLCISELNDVGKI